MTTAAPATAAPYVVTLGETMALLHNETVGHLAHASGMALGIGGAESNVAMALVRLGTPAHWIGRVGADSLGERVLRELRAEGVGLHGEADPDAPTGLMVKERRTAGSSHVWYYRTGSAGSRLGPEDIPEELIVGAAVLHVTGITPALSTSAADAVRGAISIARDAGVPLSLEDNHRAALWRDRDPGEPGELYRDIARQSTILFAGDDEARLLVPDIEDPLELASAVGELGPTQVVIKRGALGCAAIIDGHRYMQEAVPVTVVDTVGAGDAFVAGYLAELVAGENAATRLRTAVTAGAFACLSAGDWEGMPRRSELALLTAAEPVIR